MRSAKAIRTWPPSIEQALERAEARKIALVFCGGAESALIQDRVLRAGTVVVVWPTQAGELLATGCFRRAD